MTSPTAWLPLLTQGAIVPINGGPNDGAIADFNGDGIEDVVISTSAPQSVYAYLGLGDGGYAEPFVYQAGDWPIDVTVGDMNGDGLADLVVGNNGSVAVLLSQGDGSFDSPRATATSCTVGPLRVADINHDGWNDIVATVCNTTEVFSNLAQGNGAVGSPFDLFLGGSDQVDIMDFDPNFGPDIVTTNGGLLVSINDGGGGFSTTTESNVIQVSGGFAVGSFSGGAPQVAVETSNTLALLSVDSSTGLATLLSQSSLDTQGQRAVAADLNGDGFPDVVTFSNNTLGISINHGNGSFADSVDLPVGPGPFVQMIAAGDLNGDGAPDILVMFGNGPWVPYLNSCP